MSGIQPKKLIIMNILDILRRYTDADHRLSQRDIADLLKKEYDMSVDRKTIRRNILNLMDCGYKIEYSESVRMVPGKDENGDPIMEESYTWSDFYLVRDFTDGELRLLIDSLLFSQHIPDRQSKALAEKLRSLSNIYFRSHMRHVSCLSGDSGDNHQIFLNIELLDEAISRNRKVCFKYTEYGTDKMVHNKKRSDGTEREYVVTPYQMAVREGKYYLICNHEKYDNLANYRLDRIREMVILDEAGKPFEDLTDTQGNRLDLSAYMKEHPFMYSGNTVHVVMRISKSMVTTLIDMFGKDVSFTDETEDSVTATVYANDLATEQFARNYGPDVIVLSPQNLADRIRESLEESIRKYRERGAADVCG